MDDSPSGQQRRTTAAMSQGANETIGERRGSVIHVDGQESVGAFPSGSSGDAAAGVSAVSTAVPSPAGGGEAAPATATTGNWTLPLSHPTRLTVAEFQKQSRQAAGVHADDASFDMDDPRLLRQYEKLRVLGRGDVGKVYLVRHMPTGELYAMKVLTKEEMIARNKVKRVLTEREILATADHPFIVTLYGTFQSTNKLFFVMEYCAGGEFFRMLQRQPGKRLLENHAKFYAAEVLLALEYLHLMGFIYRDLKPENILLHASGHIRLTDFDLSKQATNPMNPKVIKSLSGSIQMGTAQSTQFTSFVGTEEYIAPEVITGWGQTSAVDWWTFGILLFEMMCGTTPFKGQSQTETFSNIMHGHLKFPKNLELTKHAKDIIKRLLHADPKKRLGGHYGAAEIKEHAFFKGVQWALIRNDTPPIVPAITNAVDSSNFRSYDRETDDLDFEREARLAEQDLEEARQELEHQSLESPVNPADQQFAEPGSATTASACVPSPEKMESPSRPSQGGGATTTELHIRTRSSTAFHISDPENPFRGFGYQQEGHHKYGSDEKPTVHS